MRGTIVGIKPQSRRVSVQIDPDTTSQGSNRVISDVDVPISILGYYIGSRVLVDVPNKVVIAVLTKGDNINQDPIPGNIPHRESIPATSSFISNRVEIGDAIHETPYAGFLYFLKGFITSIGASPLASISFFGLNKLIRMVSNNLEWLGRNITVKISSSNGVDPIIDITMGSLTIYSNTTTILRLKLAELFEFNINRDSIRIKLGGRVVYNFKYDEGFIPKEGEKGAFINAIDVDYIRANIIKMAINIGNMEINSTGDIHVNAVGSSESYAKSHEEYSGEKFTQVDGLYEIKAQNIAIDVTGQMGFGSTFKIKAGLLTGLELSKDGFVRIKGNRAEILGLGDNPARALWTKLAFKNIFMALKAMGAVCAASASPAQVFGLAGVPAALLPFETVHSALLDQFIACENITIPTAPVDTNSILPI